MDDLVVSSLLVIALGEQNTHFSWQGIDQHRLIANGVKVNSPASNQPKGADPSWPYTFLDATLPFEFTIGDLEQPFEFFLVIPSGFVGYGVVRAGEVLEVLGGIQRNGKKM